MPPTRELFRIGYKPNVWALPDWKFVSSLDGTFPNRYDDPRGEYRVLYAASQRIACFVEVLAPLFHIAPEVVAGLAEIEGADEVPLAQTLQRSVVASRLESRLMGTLRTGISDGQFADICSCEWVSHLRSRFLPRFLDLGIKSFDASTLLASSPRFLTQSVSRYVFDCRIRLIRYPSRHGLDLENWAFLDWVPTGNMGVENIRMDDPDLRKALQLHAVKLSD